MDSARTTVFSVLQLGMWPISRIFWVSSQPAVLARCTLVTPPQLTVSSVSGRSAVGIVVRHPLKRLRLERLGATIDSLAEVIADAGPPGYLSATTLRLSKETRHTQRYARTASSANSCNLPNIPMENYRHASAFEREANPWKPELEFSIMIQTVITSWDLR